MSDLGGTVCVVCERPSTGHTAEQRTVCDAALRAAWRAARPEPSPVSTVPAECWECIDEAGHRFRGGSQRRHSAHRPGCRHYRRAGRGDGRD